jgi:hypothetical protein
MVPVVPRNPAPPSPPTNGLVRVVGAPASELERVVGVPANALPRVVGAPARAPGRVAGAGDEFAGLAADGMVVGPADAGRVVDWARLEAATTSRPADAAANVASEINLVRDFIIRFLGERRRTS